MFLSLVPEDDRRQAAASDLRWKSGEQLSIFDGVPVAFKDMVHIKGHPMCMDGKQKLFHSCR
jgi:aspartyl-tRNA(Asn)/glutamyl-tRNA(Gln) amidotransferase subunit A